MLLKCKLSIHFCVRLSPWPPAVMLSVSLQNNFTDTLFRYDEDGYQSYCTICCYGLEVILCGNDSCCRLDCSSLLHFNILQRIKKKGERVESRFSFTTPPLHLQVILCRLSEHPCRSGDVPFAEAAGPVDLLPVSASPKPRCSDSPGGLEHSCSGVLRQQQRHGVCEWPVTTFFH